ncbi:secreted RxLR effector protein 161-like [Chrysoperla carnea]|uniref:secreted RxLR effector protein 161-like n=1 Tax=Chrysoperla carnea TaxID=189513 RepID=UPI001D09786A|nr:secreted RxLR effector protein 161-like [Chrysoperla carnea]
MEKIPYQQAVGSLLYAAQSTRPDIAYAVSLVSRYNNDPGKPHWNAVKRIFRYLKGTINKKIQYSKHENSAIMGFSDADWAGDVDNRKSVTGYVFLSQGGAICWNSKKQPTVALSTTEAEYMALSATVQEALWLRNFMKELDGKEAEPTKIYCDNKSAIDLAAIANYRPRTKHIDVRHHFIRQHILNNEIILSPVGTREMTADVLTKGLPREAHQNCIEKMGLLNDQYQQS